MGLSQTLHIRRNVNLVSLLPIPDTSDMTNAPESRVRNETLRLTLSQQEGDFIAQRLSAARRSLYFWIALAAVSAAAILISIFVTDSYRMSYDRLANTFLGYNIAMGVTVVAFITLLVGILKLPFSLLDVRKYTRFRQEHRSFLGKYGRNS
jgi:uncharacterized membrane protein